MLHYSYTKTMKGWSVHMSSIPQILSNIEKFSKSTFKLKSQLDVLLLLKQYPPKVEAALNSMDFIYHLNESSKHIEWLNEHIQKNVMPSAAKAVAKLKKNRDVMQPYADFTVPKDIPLFKKPKDMADRIEGGYEQLSFDDLNRKSIEEKGRPISPVKRIKPLSYEGNCPVCGAGSDFLYDNNGKGTQFLCKACKNVFSANPHPKDEAAMYCPHCQRKLQEHHDRKGYRVMVCPNDNCSYYLERKELVENGEGEAFRTSSDQYLLHYTYRAFKFSFDDIRQLEEKQQAETEESHSAYKAKLSRIKVDEQALALILTYYVNYGLSARKTASIMRDIHGLRISHQTVINYGNLISRIIQPMVDYYPYKTSHTLTGDETYIHVRGKNKYVFFWSDTTSRIILSYKIYDNRSTREAVQSIYDMLVHFGDDIPDDLVLITDGNPIYNAAQIFYKLCGIEFDLYQVIGVKNKDKTSKEWRPNKQREERLNRTYKEGNYNGTNGYDTLKGANSYMVLFVAFYNFLRRHSALNYRTPVDDHLFDDCELMTDKWIKLISMSTKYALQF